MLSLFLLISPIYIHTQYPFKIKIPRYSIVYTISPSNSTPSLPTHSEIYFDHLKKEYLTNIYTSKSNFSITNYTNKTFICSTNFNPITNITTKKITNTHTNNTPINKWKANTKIYRYKTLKRTHLSNSFFQIITSNKQIITNTSIIFTANKNYTVKSGLWYDHFTDRYTTNLNYSHYNLQYDPYTHSYSTNTNYLQIDHVVSIAEAFRTHTNWTKKQKKDFLNINIDSGLLPIRSTENNKKSDNPPSKYLPPNTNFQKIYIDMYVNTKKHYNLKFNSEETNII